MADTPTPAQAAENAIREEMPVVAYLTTTDEGSPAMLFFDAQEAGNYCEINELPAELVLKSDAEARLAELRAKNEKLRERFTEEECIDLFAAALHISARGDGTSQLSSENAERIVELLCDLSGIDLDFTADACVAAIRSSGRTE